MRRTLIWAACVRALRQAASHRKNSNGDTAQRTSVLQKTFDEIHPQSRCLVRERFDFGCIQADSSSCFDNLNCLGCVRDDSFAVGMYRATRCRIAASEAARFNVHGRAVTRLPGRSWPQRNAPAAHGHDPRSPRPPQPPPRCGGFSFQRMPRDHIERFVVRRFSLAPRARTLDALNELVHLERRAMLPSV